VTPPYIAVVGPGECDAGTAALAEEVGRELASRGAVVVCGGMGGAMEAACRGAKALGGTTVGLLPGTDRRHANAFVDVAIPTGLGEARNVLVVRAADVVLAVRGEFGTLSEIAFALRVGTPVVGLDTWQLSKRDEPVEAFVLAGSPAEAAELALRAAA
jgi:uncharacterized protein (TIGR00725 family)